MRHSKKHPYPIIAIIRTILFAFSATGVAALWLMRSQWGKVSVDQILFHLAVPLVGGVDKHLCKLIFLACAGALAATVLYACLCFLVRKQGGGRRWTAFILVLSLFTLFIFAEKEIHLTRWIFRQFQTTAIFDEVPSRGETGVTFPGMKRNLLLIHMESMEQTFNDTKIMGAELLPELARLQNENIHFSGFRQVPGTEWTTAGVTASTMGLPLLLPIGKNNYGGYESFLPSAPSLYDVLDENGYAMEFLFANNCSFGGTRNMVMTHAPRATVKDLLWFMHARSDVESNRGNGWGLRDRYLYERLKEDLLLRASTGRPYAIFIKTVDTHLPDDNYFVDPDVHVREQFHDFRDVLRASSVMAGELLDWIAQQDFAKDLTIVLLGDHLWMGDSVAGRPLGENRETFNLFINPVRSPESQKERIFSAPDFAPTILEAIGANLPDRRYGIGTSLFSSRKTMIEDLGEKFYIRELGKKSTRYWRFFSPLQKKPAETSNILINDFSSGAPEFIFPRETLFLRRDGTFRFAIDNRSATTLSSHSENPVRLHASLCNNSLVVTETIFDLPRAIRPGDIESAEGCLPLPKDGNYTLHLELVNANDAPVSPSFDLNATVASNWLWADGADGLPQDERDVLKSGAPLASFSNLMEVYYHGGIIFFKLLDKNLTPDQIVLRGDGVFVSARELRRAESDSFRWAAANFDGLPAEKFETGYRRDGATHVTQVSLLPAMKDASLREETDFASYVKKLVASDYLVLSAENDDLQNSFLLATRAGKIICAQSGAAPLHFDGEAVQTYLDLNLRRIENKTSADKLSMNINDVKGVTVPHGLNIAVYDLNRHLLVDRAAFDFVGSFDDLENIFSGKTSVEECVANFRLKAKLIEHRPPDYKIPLDRGAFLASWPCARAVRYLGRIWIQVPWDHAFKIRLVCGHEGNAEEFSPLERAVSASFDGLLCCVRGSENWGRAEIGYVSEDGEKISEVVDLSALYLETDFQRYLRRLANPDYVVFFSVRYAGEKCLTQTHKKLFSALGLDMKLTEIQRGSYLAVIDEGLKVYEESGRKRIEKKLPLHGQDVKLVSSGKDAGSKSSIKINDREFSNDASGINIVVYDKKIKRIIDSVCFSTHVNLAALRRLQPFSQQKIGE